MKRIFRIALSALALIIAAACLFSCIPGVDSATPDGAQSEDDYVPDGSKPGDGVRMVASITEISDRITVEVLESPYTFGTHWVITAPSTEYYAKDGRLISRSDLKVGDKVEILYSGQVMMSLPPQIVAAKISVMD